MTSEMGMLLIDFEDYCSHRFFSVRRFWKKTTEHCPETRCEISQQQRKTRKLDEPAPRPQVVTPTLFAPCGRPYSLNRPQLAFDFVDEADRIEVNLHVHKFMDTSLLEVDVQPLYLRVTVKGKIFQMAFGAEVRCEESTSQRSMSTGHLLIVMPKLSWTEEMRFQRGCFSFWWVTICCVGV